LIEASKRIRPLIVGEDQQYDEYTCHLRFRLTGEEINCKVGERFELRPGRVYEAMRVDSASDTVVIRRVADGRKFSVGKAGVPDAGVQAGPSEVHETADVLPVVVDDSGSD
jgi:hypothetical protein